MTTVRSAKSKGSSFEYDCQYSINKVEPGIWRTSERGFQLQYDLESDWYIIECKRLKGMSWNQAKKFFLKLEKNKLPRKMLGNIVGNKVPLLLFKSNQQPCLVMYRDMEILLVVQFEDYFGVSFEKHPSTRKKHAES